MPNFKVTTIKFQNVHECGGKIRSEVRGKGNQNFKRGLKGETLLFAQLLDLYIVMLHLVYLITTFLNHSIIEVIHTILLFQSVVPIRDLYI